MASLEGGKGSEGNKSGPEQMRKALQAAVAALTALGATPGETQERVPTQEVEQNQNIERVGPTDFRIEQEGEGGPIIYMVGGQLDPADLAADQGTFEAFNAERLPNGSVVIVEGLARGLVNVDDEVMRAELGRLLPESLIARAQAGEVTIQGTEDPELQLRNEEYRIAFLGYEGVPYVEEIQESIQEVVRHPQIGPRAMALMGEVYGFIDEYRLRVQSYVGFEGLKDQFDTLISEGKTLDEDPRYVGMQLERERNIKEVLQEAVQGNASVVVLFAAEGRLGRLAEHLEEHPELRVLAALPSTPPELGFIGSPEGTVFDDQTADYVSRLRMIEQESNAIAEELGAGDGADPL